MHFSSIVGNTELAHTVDPYKGMTRFPITPFFAYWLEGETFGLITQAKDPQREVNKRKSQALHHLNTCANSGWVYEEGSVVNEEDLEDFGSKPGLHIKYKKGYQKPERIQPTQLSDGHLTLAEMGYNDIKRITGVNADLLGVQEKGDPQSESGIALLRRQQQGNTVLESVFDNFRLSKLAFGKTLVDLIQKSGAYSREEILNLVVDGKEQEIAVNQGQPSSTLLAVDQLMNDLTVGRYGVSIDMQTHTPTTRMA